MNNKPLLHQWLKAIGYDETYEVTPNSLICSAHFDTSDFITEKGSYKLSATAIPKLKFEVEVVDDYIARPKTPIILDVRPSYNFDLDYEGADVSNYIEDSSDNITNMIESSNEITLSNIGSNQCQKEDSEVSNQNELSSNINLHSVNDDTSTNSRNLSSPILNSIDKSHKKKLLKISNKYLIMNSMKKQNNLTSKNFVVNNGINTSSTTSSNSELISANKSKYSNNIRRVKSPLIKKSSASRKDKFKWHNIKSSSLRCDCPLFIKCYKKLIQSKQYNRRLISKIKKLVTRKRDVLDFKAKYLQLRKKVFETEEQLLESGIDTNKFPLFLAEKDSHEIPRNVEYDVLLESRVDEINDNSSSSPTLELTEFNTASQSSPDNESEHCYGINS